MTKIEQLYQFSEELGGCTACALHSGATRKAFDRTAVFYHQTPMPILFVGMSPAYCEDRTGIPLVGYWELLNSRCGRCEMLSPCYSYFLHKTDSYKHGEQPCPFTGIDPCKLVTKAVYETRLEKVPGDMLGDTSQGWKTTDPRTAGQVFDIMLHGAGLTRADKAQYFSTKARLLGHNDPDYVPNCSVINTVQCFTKIEKAVRENVEPTRDEQLCCAKHIVKWAEITGARVVVALGKSAIDCISGLFYEPISGEIQKTDHYTSPKITDVWCNPIDNNLLPDLQAFALYHPSYHLRMIKEKDTHITRIQQEIDFLSTLKDEYCGG